MPLSPASHVSLLSRDQFDFGLPDKTYLIGLALSIEETFKS
jgi:hypothetical protein